jgi:CHAD domain-containing protein
MAKKRKDVDVGLGPAALAAGGAVATGGALAAAKLVRSRAARRDRRRGRRYRLERGEGAGEGVRRIARGQIELASELLEHSRAGDVDEAVHEARKRLKRLRALVRLARDGLGDEVYRRENAGFRDVGRDLSAVRDAQVMVDTLQGLIDRYRAELADGAFRGLLDALTGEAQAAHKRLAGDPAAVGGALSALEAMRTRVATWPLGEGEGARALAPGFERIYRRGRYAARAARKDASTENLHELRKRAKDLWHAAQVVRPVAPKQMKKLTRDAHRLADLTGDDHDLAVLLEGARRRANTLRPGELQLLGALVDRRRRELQREALGRARKVYARKARKVAKRVASARR